MSAPETEDERIADIIHEARCGSGVWVGNEHLPWSDDHREWDIATAKALQLLGLVRVAEAIRRVEGLAVDMVVAPDGRRLNVDRADTLAILQDLAK